VSAKATPGPAETPEAAGAGAGSLGRTPPTPRSAPDAAGERPGARRVLPQRLRRSGRQFVKFALVGGSGTIVNLVVLKLTLLVWGVLPPSQTFAVELAASGFAFCVAVVNNYLLNRWWTFRSCGPIRLEFGKFFTVSLIGLGMNAVFFTLFRRYVGLEVLWSQLFAIACVLPFNFTANKLWSFRQR
jgi:putative flippase GtrA